MDASVWKESSARTGEALGDARPGVAALGPSTGASQDTHLRSCRRLSFSHSGHFQYPIGLRSMGSVQRVLLTTHTCSNQ